VLQHYRELLDDPVRLGAFQRAIAAVVRPGDVVADIGCGLGTYALFALRAGARRVFAVDESPVVAVTREVVRDNGGDGAIEIFGGHSTDITPPERCDVVIFEDYLPTLMSPQKARVVRDLGARWLKPGGKLLPPRARLWLAAVEDPEGHLTIDRFHRTHDRVAGIDFSAARRQVFALAHGRKLGTQALVAAPELLHDYDLLQLRGAELSATRTLTATRDGVVHGLLLWFDLELGGTWLGTGPLAPPSAWQQTLFPLAEPLPVAAKKSIALELSATPAGESLVWRWTLDSDGRRASGTTTS
jgi:protein arginine N-methyltransferase 1